MSHGFLILLMSFPSIYFSLSAESWLLSQAQIISLPLPQTALVSPQPCESHLKSCYIPRWAFRYSALHSSPMTFHVSIYPTNIYQARAILFCHFPCPFSLHLPRWLLYLFSTPMNVLSVGKPFLRRQPSWFIRELTQGRNLIFVMNVVSPSVIREILLSIRELTREKTWKCSNKGCDFFVKPF